MKHTILVVDDERDNTEALERLFRQKYHVLKAQSGPEALKILESEKDIPLIISDQRMPEMTGVQFLEKSLKTHPDSLRILLTGFTDIESVIKAINSGQVYRYLTKPWDPIDLQATVDRAIERYELSQKIIEQNNELSVLDKAKDQFMLLINHELKTPLTSILSFLSLLKESPLNDEQVLYTNRIENSSFKLQKIIDRSLKLIKAETGRIELNIKEFPLNKLQGILSNEVLTKKMKNKKQSLEVLWDNKIKAQFDYNIIGDCLKELLENACEFSPKKANIRLESRLIGEQVKISLINTGIEIEQDTIQQILKPFTLNEDAMNHSKGLGLGLSLTNALLKEHGAELTIQSQNHSVTASFYLKVIR